MIVIDPSRSRADPLGELPERGLARHRGHRPRHRASARRRWCCARNCRIAVTTSCTGRARPRLRRRGARERLRPGRDRDRPPTPTRCQISSVTNGIDGCRSRSVRSRIHASTFPASEASSSEPSSLPFSSSSPQSQSSDQVKRCSACAASAKRYSSSAASTSARQAWCRESSHRSATVNRPASGRCGSPPGKVLSTRREAFQILFAKFRPASIASSDSGMSCWPPVAVRDSAKRRASAP